MFKKKQPKQYLGKMFYTDDKNCGESRESI